MKKLALFFSNAFNIVNNFRFYYDIQTDECKPFVYTGCGGNKNNFYTSDFCERNCKGKNIKEYKPITSRRHLTVNDECDKTRIYVT